MRRKLLTQLLVHSAVDTESSKTDFITSKAKYLLQKTKAKNQEMECSFCEQPIQSRAILLRCQHPACLSCAKDFFREPKDVRCPACNTFQQMREKFYSCLSDTPQTTLKELAEVIWIYRRRLPLKIGSEKQMEISVLQTGLSS